MIPMELRRVGEAVSPLFVLPGTHCADPEGVVVERVVTDSRETRKGDLFFAIRGPNHDGHAFVDMAAKAGAVACVVDRQHAAGAAHAIPALVVDDTITALGTLGAFYRQRLMKVGTTVIAVTGSNGKTTTKNLIDHVLSRALKGFASHKSYNNKFGVPLTLLSANAEHQYLVVEVGTNAPGEIDHLASMAAPHVGVITSVGEAHLEGLGGIAGVAAEKAALLNRIEPGGLAVVNIDRPEVRPFVDRCHHARVVSIGTHPDAKLTVGGARTTLSRTTFVLEGRHLIELPMPGTHHATNAAAAFAVARWLGMGCDEIIESLRTFTPTDGRTRRIEANGLTVIDDAYNANPSSVGAAVEALRSAADRRRVFVLGDMLELGRVGAGLHERVVRGMAASGIEVLVGVGSEVCDALTKLQCIGGPEIHAYGDVDTACAMVPQVLREGDAVWIKGSRAMRLDRLVEALTAEPPRPATASPVAAQLVEAA